MKWPDMRRVIDIARDAVPTLVVAAVLFIAGTVIGFYVAHFGLMPGSSLSDNPGDWAAFGDYLGGVLNPVVALAALGLLALSVRIQRRELHETKRALQAQAEHSEDMVWLSAMVAVIDHHERRLQALREEETKLPQGITSTNALVHMRRQEITAEFVRRTEKRDYLLNKVEQLVEEPATREIRRMARRAGLNV